MHSPAEAATGDGPAHSCGLREDGGRPGATRQCGRRAHWGDTHRQASPFRGVRQVRPGLVGPEFAQAPPQIGSAGWHGGVWGHPGPARANETASSGAQGTRRGQRWRPAATVEPRRRQTNLPFEQGAERQKEHERRQEARPEGRDEDGVRRLWRRKMAEEGRVGDSRGLEAPSIVGVLLMVYHARRLILVTVQQAGDRTQQGLKQQERNAQHRTTSHRPMEQPVEG